MHPSHPHQSSAKQPVRDATDIDSELPSLLQNLNKLGAPRITLDELAKLRRDCPSLIQNLTLVAERVQGRAESQHQRAQIERWAHSNL